MYSEKLSELDMVLSQAKELNVKPRIGIRVRLASQGKGNGKQAVAKNQNLVYLHRKY